MCWVQDDIAARLMETDELVGACKELEGLMSATMAYRTSVRKGQQGDMQYCVVATWGMRCEDTQGQA